MFRFFYNCSDRADSSTVIKRWGHQNACVCSLNWAMLTSYLLTQNSWSGDKRWKWTVDQVSENWNRESLAVTNCENSRVSESFVPQEVAWTAGDTACMTVQQNSCAHKLLLSSVKTFEIVERNENNNKMFSGCAKIVEHQIQVHFFLGSFKRDDHITLCVHVWVCVQVCMCVCMYSACVPAELWLLIRRWEQFKTDTNTEIRYTTEACRFHFLCYRSMNPLLWMLWFTLGSM